MMNEETNQYLNSFSSIIPLGGFGGPEKDQVLLFCAVAYILFPQILLANCISLGKIVTHLV